MFPGGANHLAASLVFRIGMKGGGEGGVNLGRFVGNWFRLGTT